MPDLAAAASASASTSPAPAPAVVRVLAGLLAAVALVGGAVLIAALVPGRTLGQEVLVIAWFVAGGFTLGKLVKHRGDLRPFVRVGLGLAAVAVAAGYLA